MFRGHWLPARLHIWFSALCQFLFTASSLLNVESIPSLLGVARASPGLPIMTVWTQCSILGDWDLYCQLLNLQGGEVAAPLWWTKWLPSPDPPSVLDLQAHHILEQPSIFSVLHNLRTVLSSSWWSFHPQRCFIVPGTFKALLVVF